MTSPQTPDAITKPHVIVIGGGITGLSAAWALHQSKAVTFTVLEATHQWGGKIATARLSLPEGTCLIDGGPDAFVTRKSELWDLAHQLGVGHRLIAPGSETRNMYILEKGVPIGVPLSPIKFLGSSILSFKGKLRLLAEPFIPPRRDGADESLHAFATRRLGHEAAERLIGPVLAGIYNSDPYLQSVLTTSPIMREMETEAGGLFLSALRRGLAKARQRRARRNPPPAFVTFAQGADEIITSLIDALAGDLRLDAAVQHIQAAETGYCVGLISGEQLTAQAVIVATPANQAAQMLHPLAPEAARHLTHIQQNHIGTLTLVYNRAEVQLAFPVQGLMIPRRERRAIDAVSFPAEKLRSRAPEAYTLVRVFFGGAQPSLVEMADAELIRTVQGEMRQLFNLTAQPIAYRTFKWPDSFPQTTVGHLQLVETIEANLPSGLYIAGNSYRGIGVPDCIRQGYVAAQRALSFLPSR
jgi:oxygen-dependent protoporphyrinogen oxidase